MALEIKTIINEKTLRLELSGRLDAMTAHQLEKVFKASATGMTSKVVFDFSNLEYIASAGLRSLLSFNKQMSKRGGTIKILNPNPEVLEVFDMTGFNKFFDITHKEFSNSELYPLRPIQRWFVDTHFKKAKSTMMNNGALLKLDPYISMERMAKAINDTINNHDIFRCRLTFHPETSDICQRFDGEILPVNVENITDAEFERRRQKLKEPYHLIDAPLYRIYLFKTPTAKYLYLDFYHAIMDGTAIIMLFRREIDLRYRRREIKRQPLHYSDYILQEQQISGEQLAEGHKYWREMLSGFNVNEQIPPSDIAGAGAWKQNTIKYKIKNITEEYFRKKIRRETPFFLAASMLALKKATRQPTCIMSWIHNGRKTANEMRLMGLMINQLPIKWEFEKDTTAGNFLDDLEVEMQHELAYSNSLDVVYNENLEDDCVTFIFQKYANDNETESNIQIGGNAEILYMPPNSVSAIENALDIKVNPEGDGTYTLVLDYDASRYSENFMRQFAASIDEVILNLQNESLMISKITNQQN